MQGGSFKTLEKVGDRIEYTKIARAQPQGSKEGRTMSSQYRPILDHRNRSALTATKLLHRRGLDPEILGTLRRQSGEKMGRMRDRDDVPEL